MIDTHALIWYLTDDRRLSQTASNILESVNDAIYIPAITLIECMWLVEHQRVPIPTIADLVIAIDSDDRFEFVALSRDIVNIASTLNPIREIHDRQIVATAVWLRQSDSAIALISNDRIITESRVVPVVW